MWFRVAGQIEIMNHLAINKSQKLWSAVKHISQFQVAGHLVISEPFAGHIATANNFYLSNYKCIKRNLEFIYCSRYY